MIAANRVKELINNKNTTGNTVGAKYFIYDLETYKYDFFGVGIFLDEKMNKLSYLLFDDSYVRDFVDFIFEKDICLVAFNNHHYDNKMLANVYFGEDPYIASSSIVNDSFGYHSNFDLMCKSLDLFTDMKGSMKYNQAVLGYNIKESGVGFDIDRKLTEDEYFGEVLYCLNDTETELDFFKFRMKGGATSIQNKLQLIKDYQLPHWFTRKSDNEITAHILQGVPAVWETAYDDLFNLPTIEEIEKKHLKKIDKKIVKMYKSYHSLYKKHISKVTDKRSFKKKFINKFKDNYYDLDTRSFVKKTSEILKDGSRRIFLMMSFGGSHTKNRYEVVEGRLLFVDYSSYYANLIDKFMKHLVNTKYPEIYGELLQQRIDNKEFISKLELSEESLDKIYNALMDMLYDTLTDDENRYIELNGKILGVKLLLNKAFGVGGSPTSPLFNPEKLTTITVTGQLLITELVFRVLDRVPSVMLVQDNTDGIVFKVHNKEEEELVLKIVKEFSEEINIKIDIEYYRKIIQSTVNNYILIDDDGKYKLKGFSTKNYKGTEHLEQGSRLTNSLSIKSKALVDYMVHGTPVRETVYGETDPTRFQYIVSSNSKLVGYWNETEEHWELKNNRIMVLKDSKDKIVKVTKNFVDKYLEDKNITISEDIDYRDVFELNKKDIATIALSEHDCYVTNVLEITPDIINRIDREFYVDLCEKHIATFVAGSDPEENEE